MEYRGGPFKDIDNALILNAKCSKQRLLFTLF